MKIFKRAQFLWKILGVIKFEWKYGEFLANIIFGGIIVCNFILFFLSPLIYLKFGAETFAEQSATMFNIIASFSQMCFQWSFILSRTKVITVIKEMERKIEMRKLIVRI